MLRVVVSGWVLIHAATAISVQEISKPMEEEKLLGLESGAFLRAGGPRHSVEATSSSALL